MVADTSEMLIDVSDFPVATAYLEQDDDLVWRIVWQNKIATTFWRDYDINEDFDLKLTLIEVLGSTTPTSFLHRLTSAIGTFRFLASPFQQGVLAQFYPSSSETSATDILVQEGEQSLYEAVLEASEIGVMRLDLKTHAIVYSDQVYDIVQIQYSSLGDDLEQFRSRIHPFDLVGFDDVLESHLIHNWPFEIAFRFRTDSNDYIWLRAKGKKRLSSFDSDPCFIASLEDISEQKHFEILAHSREKLIEQIIDSLPIGIYVKDDTGAYRFFSEQAARETGLDKKKVIGSTDFELYPIDLARKYVHDDSDVMNKGVISVVEEKIVLEKMETWYLKGKGPIKVITEDKEKTWLLGFSVDITHQKIVEDNLIQAKESAEALAKAKSDFLSVMSHEIRTPLNSVLGGSQLLMTEDLEPEQTKHVTMIQQAGEHLLNLINDILDYSKMDAGKLELDEHPVDLNQLGQMLVDMNRMSAEKKQVSIQFYLDDQLYIHRQSDIARLRQLLLNLLSNAIKFTDQGTVTLEIVQGRNVNDVLFKVIDTGIGISEENLSRLFSEFTQADASTTRKYGGTGLGLAICRKIVEAMGGQIGVESQVGVGSNFWFEVPMKPLETPIEKTAQANQMINETDSNISLNILVAEDNPTNQLLIKAILSKLNHQFHLVANGLEAIDAVKAHPDIDIVLMDMQMPEMDGVEATEHIRQLDGEKGEIPIIALTANASEGAKKQVLDAGMNDFLTKPIDIQALKKVLNQWAIHLHQSP